MVNRGTPWPDLTLNTWQDTYTTLHRWMQIVGKVRLACTPWINHSWHVPLYLSGRGLTTSRMFSGSRAFEIEFDFIQHSLRILVSDGTERVLPLRPRTVADFYGAVMAELRSIGVTPTFYAAPNEVENPVPFADDVENRSYDPAAAERFWQALVRMEPVFERFRAAFIGKNSPIHFFWGGFDVAVTRFSGRIAPLHPGGVPHLPDRVVREAYSHELSSAGFWPGGGPTPFPLFYSYAYPEPDGYADVAVQPGEAFYSRDLREFVLPYDAVRGAADPDAVLMRFLQTTYEAAAELGRWDRAALERPEGWRLGGGGSG